MSLAFGYVHTVTVETYAGPGAHGPAYTAPVPVKCWVEDGAALDRDPDQREIRTATRIHAALSAAGTFADESRVTLPTGRVATVTTVNRFDTGGLLPIDHIEVLLG